MQFLGFKLSNLQKGGILREQFIQVDAAIQMNTVDTSQNPLEEPVEQTENKRNSIIETTPAKEQHMFKRCRVNWRKRHTLTTVIHHTKDCVMLLFTQENRLPLTEIFPVVVPLWSLFCVVSFGTSSFHPDLLPSQLLSRQSQCFVQVTRISKVHIAKPAT